MRTYWTLKHRLFSLLIATVACLWAAAPAHAAAHAAKDPPLTVPQSQLDSALHCDEFTHRERPPVLFVHGAFATGPEEWDWTTRPELRARGFATCVVTLPNRVIGSDLQVAAEYVVNAVHRMYEGGDRRKVAVIGHSAGAPVARWALRWWRGVRMRVADFVSLAGINHGAMFEPSSLSGTALMTPMMWQLSVGSRFLQALNEDEAPRPVDYTAIYSRYDVFQLPPHEGRAAIALGEGRANVSNILIQDVCPGMLTEHFTLITDASVYSLIVDALLHSGPASVARSGAREACTLSPLNPSALTALERLARELPVILADSIANGPPELPLVSEEPPLKPYVGSGPRRKGHGLAAPLPGIARPIVQRRLVRASRGGGVALPRLACRRGRGECAGRLGLQAGRRGALVGLGSYRVAPGQARTARIRLSRAAARYLRRRGAFRARLTITRRGVQGERRASRGAVWVVRPAGLRRPREGALTPAHRPLRDRARSG